MLHLRKLIPFILGVFLISCKSNCEVKSLEEEGKFSKQNGIDLAMAQEFMMTKDPALGYVPRERLYVAQTYMKSMLAMRGNRTTDFTWNERGPNNVAGRTRALFIDKQDASGNTVFAASVSGGIWKATNFKSTPSWTPVFETMGNLAVCALAQDPINPAVIYAGTGEGNFNYDAVRGNGIWKSVNGGTSWAQLPVTDSTNNTNFQYVQDLVVTGTGTLFAATRSARFCNAGGIFRSVDGGASWTRSLGNLSAQLCDSAFNFRGGDLEIGANGDIYAATGFQGGLDSNLRGRIYRSAATNGVNTGAAGTWVEITPAGNWQRIEMACAPNNSAILYALMEGQEDGIGGIRRSSNFGQTWETINPPTWCSQGTNSSDFTNKQAWFSLIVNVDPNDANTVYIGGIDLFKSTNGGTNWTQITQWTPTSNSRTCNLPQIHADQHNIIFYPGSSSEFIASNDGGVYLTGNAGTAWTAKNLGYNVTQFYACDYHPTDPNYFLAGSQDNGTQKFTQPGLNSTIPVTGGDGGYPHIDQNNSNIQISAYVFNHYFYSRNGGNTFSDLDINENGLFINATDYDDVNHVLYAGNNENSLGVITNFAGTGTPPFNNVAISQLGGREITAIKVDPNQQSGSTIWVAGYFGGDATTQPLVPNILKVTGAHTLTATTTTTGALPVPAGAYVSSIDVDRTNSNHLLVTLSNYGVPSVLESTNGGTTWTNIETNLPDIPVRWGIFVAPTAQLSSSVTGGIMVATELGVWTTSTLGAAASWIPNNKGLANVRTDMLKYRISDGLVAAASHGRGLFTTLIPGGALVVTGVPNTLITKDFIKYISATSNNLSVVTGSLNTRTMDVQIYDMKGSLVYRRNSRYQNSFIDLNSFSRGSYIIKIFGDKKESFVGQFIKQ